MEPDFEALVIASRMAHTKTGLHDLWKAAIALPAWYFVAGSSEPDAEPIIGSVSGKPFVLAFTDEPQAAEFTKRRAAHRGNVDTPVLHMEPGDAVQYFKSLREGGVEGVLFNSGMHAFESSLVDVIDMYSRYAR